MSSSRRLYWMAIASIGVAAMVLAIKYAAYRMTGSVALYSDALESIVNVLTACIALIAIRISARPADRHHQYGHHKAEYFSAVMEGALIIVAAMLILREALAAIQHPREIERAAEGIAINLAASALNAGWAWALIRRGRAWRSPALVADGWHLLSDVATSVVVAMGLALAAVTGIRLLDPLLAALVAFYILWVGLRLVRGSASNLMDEAVANDVAQEIHRVIAAAADGALQVHDVRTRTAGAATFIEFHLVVPGDMTVDASHVICDRIEAALEATIEGADVLIHVEPDHKAKSKGVIEI